MNELVLIDDENIQNKIFTIRGLSVMLDRDLAELYQVENRVLNQSVKRNVTRFPYEFMFQLTKDEFEIWKSQIVISNSDKMGLRKLPYVFTEQGVSMLSAVLKSEIAIAMSIKIINSFVSMRKNISDNTFLSKRLEILEHKQCINDDKFNFMKNDKISNNIAIIPQIKMYSTKRLLNRIGKMNLENLDELKQKIKDFID